MHDERKLRGKASKSFARRIIKVWIFGVLVPLLVVESLILWQFYRINHNDVDEEIENNLNKVSVDMKDLMNNMNSISWLLEADGTVGKNLHLYFDEEDTIKKGDLLIYLREQIANYEIANPSIGNLTYIYIPRGETTPVKINQTSLANGELPDDTYYLCKWQNMNFYGPHESKSKVASYPCFSLLRSYKMEQEYGDIYIYLESGYKYLQKLIPGSVMGMDTVFLIESEEGRTMYCSDSRLVPLYSDLDSYRKELEEKNHLYKTYVRTEEGGWKIHLWVPVREYYRQIYGMALNLSVVTLLAVFACILVSVLQWKSIYTPFTKFEKRLQLIASDNDVETKVGQMNIQEFDDNFALLDKMKSNILLLLNRVQAEGKKRSELELKVVLGKINPHFLYNTLESIRDIAMEEQVPEIAGMSDALARLFRYNVKGDANVPFSQELEITQAYLDIQKARFPGKLEVICSVRPETLSVSIMKFLLQPLVENAVFHGIEPALRKGTLFIGARVQEGRLLITIQDDGIGIPPEQFAQLQEHLADISFINTYSQQHVGILNVAHRILLNYGEGYGLTLESAPEEGTRILLTLPADREGDAS